MVFYLYYSLGKDMDGCENGGCGHYRLESEIFTDLQVSNLRPSMRPALLGKDVCSMMLENTNIGSPMSHEEIDRESTTTEQPEGIDLPVFDTYEAFFESDFFQKYYDLGLSDVYTFTTYDLIDPIPPHEGSIKVQRMLLVLGYLQISDFERERLFTGDAIENEISDFGVLQENDKRAIERLQKNYGILVDGIIGNDTKRVLYRLMFHFFHSMEREECTLRYREMIGDLQLEIVD